MDISSFLQYGVTLIGLLIGGLGLLKSRQKDAAVDTASKALAIKDDYIKTLESQNGRLSAEKDGFKRQVNDLKEFGQGSPQLKVLSQEFAKFTKAMIDQSKLIRGLLKQNNGK